MLLLKELVGTTKNGLPADFDLAYNWTGKMLPVGQGTRLQDIAETFLQRAHELDPTSEMEKHVYLIWDAVRNTGSAGLWRTVERASSNLSSALGDLYTTLTTKLTSSLALLLSSPQTEANYAEQSSRITDKITQGQMLLFVAHSQGNLFANHAYETFLPRVGSDRMKLVHIAPASPIVHGKYVLADIDLVINAMRLQGPGTVQPINLTMPISLASDPSGHEFIQTYLDSTRAVQPRSSGLLGATAQVVVLGMINDAFNSLVPPFKAGKVGAMTITLTWDGPGDVDLHVVEPGGSHVYFDNKVGQSGELDEDNIVGFGPEHYNATCDASRLQTGTFYIGIENFSRADGRTATVQVASLADGVLDTRSFVLGASTPGTALVPVFTVTVSKDSNGVFRYAAN